MGLSRSIVLIIVVASVERFAYKGVASNLVTYFTSVVKMSTSAAAKSISNWSGVTSMLPLVSAVLVDSYWDRYSTICASSLLYIGGLVMLTSWALLYSWMPRSSLFFPLYLISIGQAGYNPSLQAFGADQLKLDDGLPENKSQFFQWWYMGVCMGSLLGNSLMSYVQDNLDWGLGFAIPTIAMAISVIAFFKCAPLYMHKKKPKKQSPELELVEADCMEEEKPLCEAQEVMEHNSNHNHPRVFETVLRLLPIWLMLLMFAVIFQQPATFFTKQGMGMRRNISIFEIPPAMLQSTVTISIVLLMPVYDKLIIPAFRFFTKQENGVEVLQRIGIGMALSILAMVVAALVEARRIRSASSGDLSIFWLFPQYILLGASDVFTVVGMQEFFYSQVPSTMRTIGIALYLSVFGVGSFLSALLVSIVELLTCSGEGRQCWFSDDTTNGRLDKYYWALALLSGVSFLVFAFLCRFYSEHKRSDIVQQTH